MGKEDKRSAFHDIALYDGLKSPGHIYSTDVTKIKPKIMSTTIYKSTKDRFDINNRKPSPTSPCLYDTQASFYKNQLKF